MLLFPLRLWHAFLANKEKVLLLQGSLPTLPGAYI